MSLARLSLSCARCEMERKNGGVESWDERIATRAPLVVTWRQRILDFGVSVLCKPDFQSQITPNVISDLHARVAVV